MTDQARSKRLRSDGERLIEIGERLRDVFQRAVRVEGLTYMEGRTLRLVARTSEQAHLGASLGLTPSRVSALLGALERRRLVVRTTARGDRRHREIRLSAAGVEALERIDSFLADHSPILRALDAGDRATLRALLDKLDPPADAA